MAYTDEQKRIIDSESSDVQLVLSFPGSSIADITNSNIYSESMSLTESLYEGEDIAFGKCNASCFRVRVADKDTDFVGKTLVAKLVITDSDNNSVNVPIGKYTVFSAEKSADRMWKDIVAYDYMTKFDVDIAAWYNNTLYPTKDTVVTVRNMFNSLCSYIGVECVDDISMVNGFLSVGKTIEPTTLSARDLLQSICEINGSFGHFNSNGKLEFIKFNREDLLLPREVLYPSNSLFPKSGFFNDPNDITVYKSCDYKDFETKPIDCIQIRMEDEDVGITYYEETSNNVYVVVGNPLTFGLEQEVLTQVASNLLEDIKNAYFQPCNTTISKGLYIEIGNPYDIFVVQPTEEEVITTQLTSFVMRRELSGIQAISSNFISEGTETYKEYTSALNSEYKALQGKYHKLVVDNEKISSELVDLDENLRGVIEASAESLRTEFSEEYVSNDDLEALGLITQNLLIGTDLNNKDFNSYYSNAGTGSVSINNTEAYVQVTGSLKFKSNTPRLVLTNKYTISFEITEGVTEDEYIYIQLFARNDNGEIGEIGVSRYAYAGLRQFTFDITDFEDNTKTIFDSIIINCLSNVALKIKNIKLEKGNRATEWVPAASDSTKGQINELRTEFNSSIKQTAKQIEMTVSESNAKWDIGEDTFNYYGYGSAVNFLGVAEERWLNKTYLDSSSGKSEKCVLSNGNYVWSTLKQYETVNDTLSSRISQTASSIELSVDDKYNSAGIKISLKNEDGDVLDEETANISMTGLVSFNDLSNTSKTSINGGTIKTGTISAARLDSKVITTDNLSAKTISGSQIKGGTITGQTISGGTITGTNISSSDNFKMLMHYNALNTGYEPIIQSTYENTGTPSLPSWSSVAHFGRGSLKKWDVHFDGYNVFNSAYFNCVAHPYVDNKYTLGTSVSRWYQLYATHSTSVTSDRNQKRDITEIPEKYESMFSELNPVTYYYKDGDRVHVGFIAQEVEEAMNNNDISNTEYGALCKDEVDGKEVYGLRYEEFIALNTHMIQKQQAEISELKEQIAFLIEKLEKLGGNK